MYSMLPELDVTAAEDDVESVTEDSELFRPMSSVYWSAKWCPQIQEAVNDHEMYWFALPHTCQRSSTRTFEVGAAH